MRTHSGCRLTETCCCTICLRQPLHCLVQRYTYITNLSKISSGLNWPLTQPINNLCTGTKKQVDQDDLLPPEFPEVRICFIYEHPSIEYKFHRYCLGAGSWHGELIHTCPSADIAIHSLVTEEERNWCRHCGCSLFSQLMSRSVTCEHLNIEIVCRPYPFFVSDIHGKTLQSARRPGSPLLYVES